MQLKAKCVWKSGYETEIDNARGHSVKTDLPENKGGSNVAAMALELTIMSLAGCVVTIFALLAKKMNISFTKLSCEITADRPDNASTITKCYSTVKVTSDATKEKLQFCLDKTEKICPVGVIFEKANIKVENKLEVNS